MGGMSEWKPGRAVWRPQSIPPPKRVLGAALICVWQLFTWLPAPLAAQLSLPAAADGSARPAALSPGSGAPVAKQEVAPASVLVLEAPVESGDVLVLRGTPSQVFPHLIRARRSDGLSLGESEWLNKFGIQFEPPSRDPVVAPDYAAPAPGPALTYHLDALPEGLTSYTIHLVGGRGEFRGAAPGDYCFIIPGKPPLAASTAVEGPVTILEVGQWAPLAAQLYVAALSELDLAGFQTALSPAPFAQINPLIDRLRKVTRISPVELFLFYRGYYEALGMAHWLETSPDSNLHVFLERMQVDNSAIDQLVMEALRREDWLRILAGSVAPGATPLPSSASASGLYAPPPTSAPHLPSSPYDDPVAPQAPSAPYMADTVGGPTISLYRSYYYAGMTTFFAAEASEKRIPGLSEQFIHPELANAYRDQNLFLARQCYEQARRASLDNPLLPTLADSIAAAATPQGEALHVR